MLARLCEHDMSQRALSFPEAEKARASLGNRTHFLKRHVDGVLVKKALALWHKAQKEPYLVVQGRFMSEVIQTASLCVSSTAIDEHILVDLGVSQEQVDRLAAERPHPTTYISDDSRAGVGRDADRRRGGAVRARQPPPGGEEGAGDPRGVDVANLDWLDLALAASGVPPMERDAVLPETAELENRSGAPVLIFPPAPESQ